jgi:hypothetical protein
MPQQSVPPAVRVRGPISGPHQLIFRTKRLGLQTDQIYDYDSIY